MRGPGRGDIETQTVATYGFNVPCRRFMLTFNITRDRRMPIVDEYVLRVLKVAERLAIDRLGSFFGFSRSEMGTVIDDLQARNLVAVAGEDVELAPRAQELLRLAPDGVPQILQLETWVDRLWFDLVSRNMMAPERTRPLDNLIDLKPLSEAKNMPTTFAREAFEQRFNDFLTKVRHINNPDSIALYSVSDVAPERYGSVVLSGSMELDLNAEPRLRPRLLKGDVTDLARYRPLSEAMHDAVRRLTHPDPSQTALAEFRRLTGDATVATHNERPEGFRPAAWLADPGVRATLDRSPLVGSSYLERNVGIFRALMERRGLPRLKDQVPRPLQLFWFRPNGSAWGASYDVQKAVSEIAAITKSTLTAQWSIRTTLIASSSAARESQSRFRRVFDRGLASQPGYLSAGTEVLLLPGVAAMVLTQVAISPTIPIPVGLAITANADLHRLEHALKLTSIETEHEMLWQRPSTVDREGQMQTDRSHIARSPGGN